MEGGGLAPRQGELFATKSGQRPADKFDITTCVRDSASPTNQVEQGGLTPARATFQGCQHPVRQVQVNSTERLHFLPIGVVDPPSLLGALKAGFSRWPICARLAYFPRTIGKTQQFLYAHRKANRLQPVVRFCCYVPPLLLFSLWRALLQDTGGFSSLT